MFFSHQEDPRTDGAGSLLLHVCCGPCLLIPLRELRDQGFAVAGLFYNPNIHGVAEYLKRRETLADAAARLEFPITYLDAEYDPSSFFRAVTHHEDERCPRCYRLRLERTFRHAREHGFRAVSSTLLYSKYQDQKAIQAVGAALQDQTGVRFIGQDFRPGWQEGIELSKKWGLYRQNYCGCLYSELDRRRKTLARLASGTEPLPGSPGH